ncbi:hypothetical protein VE03_07217 [Pseudogymnoascus sp. 23342-1-I1]|nr:hypothetical protein VE03_07217 [Pseudogymnoascus sp. 23342-1-I1]
MEELNPNHNQVRRRGRWSAVGEGQGLFSENDMRNREHDRQRRRRDLLRAQQVPSLQRIPISLVINATSSLARTPRDNPEDETILDSALVLSPPSFSPISPVEAIDDDSGGGMGQNLPLVSSESHNPVSLEFACANSGLSKLALSIWRKTSQQDYAVLIEPIDKLYQSCNTIQSFVEEIGTPAALLIWPLGKAREVTELSLHQLPVAFVSGMAQFIKGFHEFPAIRDLINHISTWIDGWTVGSIQHHVARDYLDTFMNSGNSPGEDFGSLSMHHVLTSFSVTWGLRGLPSPTVGKLGNQFTFNATGDIRGFNATGDLRAFRPTCRLNERAVASVLATTDLPANVICGRASQYGSCHNDRIFTFNKAMTIDPQATTILCPVHTGTSDQWIGVVVRLTRGDVRRPVMTLELLDSLVHRAGVSLYN